MAIYWLFFSFHDVETLAYSVSYHVGLFYTENMQNASAW